MRDTVGNNLALGIGEGFTSTMADVNDDMINSIPTSFDVQPEINSVQAINSSGGAVGTNGFAFYLNIDNFNNYTNNDLESIMDYASQYFSAQMERRGVVF